MKNKKRNTLNPNYDVEQGREQQSVFAEIFVFSLFGLIALASLFILSQGA